jgi:hypothetical protein
MDIATSDHSRHVDGGVIARAALNDEEELRMPRAWSSEVGSVSLGGRFSTPHWHCPTCAWCAAPEGGGAVLELDADASRRSYERQAS